MLELSTKLDLLEGKLSVNELNFVRKVLESVKKCFLCSDLFAKVGEDKAEKDVCLLSFKDAVLCKVPVPESFASLSARCPSEHSSVRLHCYKSIVCCLNLPFLSHMPLVNTLPRFQSICLLFLLNQ